jgi:hypothetical protein
MFTSIKQSDMLQKRIVLLVSGLLFMLFVIAQDSEKRVTISGFVKVAGGKNPLVNATVELKDTANKKITALTETDGSFQFKTIKSGIYSLSISYTNYIKYQTDSLLVPPAITQLNLPEIYLEPSATNLKEVVVTGNQSFIKMAADKITLTVAQNAAAAGNTVYDLLLQAPGVLADNNGNITVKQRSVTVFMDGRPTYLSGEQLKLFLTNQAATGVEKIDIITSPSAKYDAQGGVVIDIKTAKNKNFGTNGTLTTGVGTGRFFRGNSGVSLNYRNKKVSINGGADYMHNAQYYNNRSERNISNGMIRDKEYEIRTRDNISARMGLDYTINKTTSAGFMVKGFMNFRDRSVSNTAIADLNGILKDSSSTVQTKGYARFASPSVNIYFKKTLDTTGKELTINADYLLYDKIWYDNFTTDFFDHEGKLYLPAALLRNNSPAQNTIRSVSADYTHPLKKNATLETGIKSIFSRTNNNVLWENYIINAWRNDVAKTNHFIYDENIIAAYATFNKTIKKLGVEAGIRAEQTFTKGTSVTLNTVLKNQYLNLFPNIGLTYEASQNHQWGLSYRKNIERYGFDFVNPFIVYQNQYTYSQGNPYLLPQINHNIELSHSYKYQLFTSLSYIRSVKALAPVYKLNASNNLLISSYDNLGTADIATLMVTWSKVFFKKWTSVNTAGGFYMNYNIPGANANEQISGYFSSNNTLTFKKFSAQLNAVYRSPLASGIFTMNAFSNITAAVNVPVLKKKGNIKLNVTDVFNTQIFESSVINFQQVTGVFVNKPETRFINLVFTWRFGNTNVKTIRARKTGIEAEKGRMGVE